MAGMRRSSFAASVAGCLHSKAALHSRAHRSPTVAHGITQPPLLPLTASPIPCTTAIPCAQAWFLSLLEASIQGAERSQVLAKRTEALLAHFQHALYVQVCR